MWKFKYLKRNKHSSPNSGHTAMLHKAELRMSAKRYVKYKRGLLKNEEVNKL